MQKILIITILTLITLSTITTAQNVGDIQASFCNQNEINSELDILTTAGLDTDICIKFQNNSIQDINLSINFVDGALTPQGSKACFSAEKPKLNFGQHILPYEEKLTIKAQQEIQQTYKIKFPLGFSGIIHGCLAYNIDNSNDIAGGIGLVFRKVHTIDILVGGSEINSQIQVSNFQLYSSGFSNRLNIDIENNGNIDQTVQLSGIIGNILGYSKTFITQKQTIKAQETLNIKTEIANIPKYKGFFNLKGYLSYTPIFNFDITNHSIPAEYITPGTITITRSIMLRNWFYIVGLSLIAILISINIIKYIKK